MERSSLNKVINCVYPWNGLTIRPDGMSIPCCMYNDQKTLNFESSNISMKDLRNSPEWDSIRNDMLNNKFPTGCADCKDDEVLGLQSLRVNGLKRFIPITTEKAGKIKILETAFSNLCDSACLHCSSYFSSKWASEDFVHGRSTKKSKIQINDTLDSEDLSEVEILKIIGGEPLLEQEKFSNLLDRINLKNCSIKICTNGRHIPNLQITDKLKNAKAILLVVSVDGIESLNEWYRWPVKWAETEITIENLEKKFSNLPNFYLHLHCCISVYNVFYLEKIIRYFRTKWPKWKIEFDWIRTPTWQSIEILPSEIKQDLYIEMKELEKTLNDLTYFCDQNPYTITANKLLKESSLDEWEKCKEMTEFFAKERNQNIKEINPKFFQIMENAR